MIFLILLGQKLSGFGCIAQILRSVPDLKGHGRKRRIGLMDHVEFCIIQPGNTDKRVFLCFVSKYAEAGKVPRYSVSVSSDAIKHHFKIKVKSNEMPTKAMYSHHTIYFLKNTRRNKAMIKGNE